MIRRSIQCSSKSVRNIKSYPARPFFSRGSDNGSRLEGSWKVVGTLHDNEVGVENLSGDRNTKMEEVKGHASYLECTGPREIFDLSSRLSSRPSVTSSSIFFPACSLFHRHFSCTATFYFVTWQQAATDDRCTWINGINCRKVRPVCNCATMTKLSRLFFDDFLDHSRIYCDTGGSMVLELYEDFVEDAFCRLCIFLDFPFSFSLQSA